MPRPRPADGFTLVEMLVVLIIIGILAGILLPALGSARTAARKGVAAADIQLLTTALRQYERDFGVFPPESASPWYFHNGPYDGVTLPAAANRFSVTLTSPEALVFFLTRSFRKNSTAGSATEVSANVDAGPYLELKTKQRGNGSNSILNGSSTVVGRTVVFKDPFGMNQSYGYANNTDGNNVYFTHGVRVAGVCTRCGTTVSADNQPHGPHNAASFDIYSAGPDGADQCGRSGKSDDGRTTDDLNNW
ncbi:MAG: prepilin-type N-terminal cleavage/methylation domain-containing protein [Planctomycetes bacterium]|nr:prepilin-type N-terminal cleavage/methylation domain-containing protein [Planctomycetota bacterium]